MRCNIAGDEVEQTLVPSPRLRRVPGGFLRESMTVVGNSAKRPGQSNHEVALRHKAHFSLKNAPRLRGFFSDPQITQIFVGFGEP
jgi:hypothetical protein